MKKLSLGFVSLLGTTLIFGTALADSDTSETRNLEAFTKIILTGSADVNVVVGETQSVEVRTESDYLDRVITEVRGNTLYISQEGRKWRKVDVTVEVRVESLNGVTIKGSGDFDVSNVNSDTFNLGIEGSGDIYLSGESGSFDVDVNGSGDVTLLGTCGSLAVDIGGSGDVDAENLKCKMLDLTVGGSGDIDAFASDSVIVNIRGSGDVMIFGDPDRVRPKINGSGSFEIVDES